MPHTSTRWQPHSVRDSTSRPRMSEPKRNSMPCLTDPGGSSGTSGLFGSASGRYGAVTAISSQKQTSVSPSIATQDSHQRRMAMPYSAITAGIAGSSTYGAAAPRAGRNMTYDTSGSQINMSNTTVVRVRNRHPKRMRGLRYPYATPQLADKTRATHISTSGAV